ncbi:PAS domain-containing protein [Candidatus Poribacteria bacterium]|nr:PAS domain-containing protein [Candidatus Poribacteria bacterium]
MEQTQLFPEKAVDDELPLKLELIKQIGWLVRLRWIAIAGVFFTVTVANLAWDMIANPIPLYITAGLMVLYNFEPRMYRKAPELQRLKSIKRQSCIHIILDLLSLIALIHFSGGVENPFIFYFIFHLIIASIILSKRVSYILATLNTVLLSSLIFLEYFEILPHYPLNNFLPNELWQDPVYIFGVLFVFTSTLFFSVYLATTITQTARERETETRELKENLEEKVDELVETRKEVVFERNKLQSIIECMQEGVVFVDSTNQTTLFNKAAQSIQREQTDLEMNTDLQFGSTETLAQISQDFSEGSEAIERKNQQVGEKHLENTYAAVRDDEDNYLGTVLVSRDVTDRKRMEQQLIFSEKMAAIGELAAGVAHEINNPLDGLLNCILRIQRNPKNIEQTQEYLGLMEEAIRRIEATIGKLLDFSRPHELTLTAINLNDVVNETIGLIGYGASEKGIKIEKDFQDQIALIHGDKHLLEQVTLNLALNAITAMPDGGTLLFQTGEIILDALIGKPIVYVKVIDTGIGISESVQDRIFDPFYTTQITEKGTGLGLSVSDRIVRQHQGVIEVESEVGSGSTFTVKLPIAAQEQT